MAAGHKPDDDDAVLQLEAFLPYQLNVVAQAVSHGLAELYSSEFGISIPEWRILAALGELRVHHPSTWQGMTARDLAHHGRMGKVMVSRAATALLRRKILVKCANRKDRREAFLRLSAKGEAIYSAIVPKAKAYQALLGNGISDCDAKAFNRVLKHLLVSADAADTCVD